MFAVRLIIISRFSFSFSFRFKSKSKSKSISIIILLLFERSFQTNVRLAGRPRNLHHSFSCFFSSLLLRYSNLASHKSESSPPKEAKLCSSFVCSSSNKVEVKQTMQAENFKIEKAKKSSCSLEFPKKANSLLLQIA